METSKNADKLYYATESCVFRKTKEKYGGLSNMASGFPLKINNIDILTVEALYQALRFPHLPEIQEKILLEKSPMAAKMVGKPFRKESRPDWESIKINIMRWCLRVKLAQNFLEFGKLLESTFDKPIVEDSSKDNFWGAIRTREDENVLKGTNALGRLLMELRQLYNEERYSFKLFVVEPLIINDFLIYNKPIETIDERESFISFFKFSTHYPETKKPASSSNKSNDDAVNLNEYPASFLQPNSPDTISNQKDTVEEKSKESAKRTVEGKNPEQGVLPF